MPEEIAFSRSGRFLLIAASFVVVVAGMRAAATIIVPFLLALFIATISLPPMTWMQRRKIPDGLAILIIIVGIIAAGTLLGTFVGTSVNDFLSRVDEYAASLSAQSGMIIELLDKLGIEVSAQTVREHFNPGVVMKMAGNMLSGLSGTLTNAFMILLTVVFILLEASGFPRKLRAALKNPEGSLARASTVQESINQYLAIKTLFSLMTGLVVWLWLFILGVDYPVLWGLLAFLLNYVPNIGSIIAAIPAVLLAFVQLGPGRALLAALGYVVVNVLFGSILEPRFMGRGLGLSTLVVFLSLVFWGWVLGPVGMLLSVPLTMILKIALEGRDDTRWLGVLLGSEPAPAKTS